MLEMYSYINKYIYVYGVLYNMNIYLYSVCVCVTPHDLLQSRKGKNKTNRGYELNIKAQNKKEILPSRKRKLLQFFSYSK